MSFAGIVPLHLLAASVPFRMLYIVSFAFILWLMRIVNVPLGARSYRIEVGRDLLKKLGPTCRELKVGERCAIITDSNAGPLYAKKAAESLRSAGFEPLLITIPAGEKSKNLKLVASCYDQLAAHRLERNCMVIALGGGVVGDLAGFVAASYLRGVPFVQIPTTLLAQVDSSVGGKVGVNLKAGKNLVGAFYQPLLVLCDLATLDTLPIRELRAGMAEVIKYGIIYDPVLFARIERHLPALMERNAKELAEVVARCCEIKAEVVGQDEREGGLRAILNFGHTIGHGLEAISSYGKYLHGEAISIGQVAAARISQIQSGLAEGEFKRIRELFRRAGLPVSVQLTNSSRQKLFNAMLLDKKVAQGEVKFVLATGIGKVQYGKKVPRDTIDRVLDELAANLPGSWQIAEFRG